MAGFAVELKRDCPHVEKCVEKVHVLMIDKENLNEGCQACDDSTENWICLSCFCIRCSRYVKGHMQEHFKGTKTEDASAVGHPIGLSFSDLSVWCNLCEAYVGHPRLKPYIDAVYSVKFVDGKEEQTGDDQEKPFKQKPDERNPTSGASTAHKTEEEYVEHFDSPEVFDKKIKKLAGWVRESKHMTAFTGAGVSTSTGVPDFRSGLNTVLKTGAGAWTLSAANQNRSKSAQVKSTLQAIPSKTHMSLVELNRRGHMRHLISQNCDGLHRRSGFPVDSLSELHGNTNLESCEKCGKEYMRDHHTRNAVGVFDHRTGRKCGIESCGGPLKDTIINFGENLPEKPLNDADVNSRKSDLCLAMGSSLRVTPACLMPEIVARNPKGRLVVVNLQSTPLDGIASMRINAMCDDVMEALMKELDYPIPDFRLRRFIRLERSPSGKIIKVSAVDSDETPLSLFMGVENKDLVVEKEPFCFPADESPEVDAKFTLHFVGHYGEPPLEFSQVLHPQDVVTLVTHFDPRTGEWTKPVDRSSVDIADEAKSDDMTDDTPQASSSSSSGASPSAKPDQDQDPSSQRRSDRAGRFLGKFF